jgi:hypothetical protein
MSKKESAIELDGEREFVAPEGQAQLEFVKLSQLKKDNFEGIILDGEYLGEAANKFNEEKPNFRFKADKLFGNKKPEGSEVIVNAGGNLNHIMKGVKKGDYCRLIYEGTSPMAKGKFKGTQAHQLKILVSK